MELKYSKANVEEYSLTEDLFMKEVCQVGITKWQGGKEA